MLNLKPLQPQKTNAQHSDFLLNDLHEKSKKNRLRNYPTGPTAADHQGKPWV